MKKKLSREQKIIVQSWGGYILNLVREHEWKDIITVMSVLKKEDRVPD